MQKELFEPCEMTIQTLVDVITTSGVQNFAANGEYAETAQFEYDTQGN